MCLLYQTGIICEILTSPGLPLESLSQETGSVGGHRKVSSRVIWMKSRMNLQSRPVSCIPQAMRKKLDSCVCKSVCPNKKLLLNVDECFSEKGLSFSLWHLSMLFRNNSLSFSLSDTESYTHWQRSLFSPPILTFSLLFPLTPFFHKQQEFLSEKKAVKCFELQSLSDGQTQSVSL